MTNNGPDPADGVTVTDVLAEGVGIDVGRAVAGKQAGGTVTCDLGKQLRSCSGSILGGGYRSFRRSFVGTARVGSLS